MQLRIGYSWRDTEVLGPGHRFALWLQGCERRCLRCTSPNLQPLEGGSLEEASVLAHAIADTAGIRGVTISGGEPFLQADALAELLAVLRGLRPDLDVIVFTGYRKEELSWPEAERVLGYVDLLIDGEYVDALNDDRGLRGSSNQRMFFLTSRLLPFKDMLLTAPRKREMHLLAPGDLLVVGIPPRRTL